VRPASPTPSHKSPAEHPDKARDALRRRYVAELLRLYLATPGVAGRVRRADRHFAASLFDQGVPLYAIENAFVVTAARRVRHNAFATPLPAIRTLWYFREVIREILDRPPGPRDIEQMREALLRQR
jgi:hypothetical protein